MQSHLLKEQRVECYSRTKICRLSLKFETVVQEDIQMLARLLLQTGGVLRVLR